MKKVTYTLEPTEEYIPLYLLLKIMQIAQTGGHAKKMIEEGEVTVNGTQEFRKRNKLVPGDIIIVDTITIGIVK